MNAERLGEIATDVAKYTGKPDISVTLKDGVFVIMSGKWDTILSIRQGIESYGRFCNSGVNPEDVEAIINATR